MPGFAYEDMFSGSSAAPVYGGAPGGTSWTSTLNELLMNPAIQKAMLETGSAMSAGTPFGEALGVSGKNMLESEQMRKALETKEMREDERLQRILEALARPANVTEGGSDAGTN